MKSNRPSPRRRTARPDSVAVWALGLLPAAWLLWDALAGELSANPVEEITHRTGWWALSLLLATLCVTPLRRATGWNRLAPQRRTLGLLSFGYATLHLLTYFGLDQGFAVAYLAEDVAERPYITVGFSAFLLLLPLAVTSTRGWIRRLGPRWQRLHRLVYPAAGLGVVHFLWQVKADAREPFLFGGALALLLLLRLPRVRERVAALRVAAPPPPVAGER